MTTRSARPRSGRGDHGVAVAHDAQVREGPQGGVHLVGQTCLVPADRLDVDDVTEQGNQVAGQVEAHGGEPSHG